MHGSYSTIRQVPDHQEVYLASTGFTSVVFDLTERVLDAQDDLEALERHLADILGEDDHADQRVKRSQDVTVTQPDKLPYVTRYNGSFWLALI